MYNGIGLQTPRGSGTNGYIQTNKFFVRPRGGKPSSEGQGFEGDQGTGGISKKPNKDILEHDRKRQIHLKLVVLEDKLIEQGYTDAEIAEKLDEARKVLEVASDSDSAGGLSGDAKHSDTQTHQIAARKERQMEVLRGALGIKMSDPEIEMGELVEDGPRKSRAGREHAFLDRDYSWKKQEAIDDEKKGSKSAKDKKKEKGKDADELKHGGKRRHRGGSSESDGGAKRGIRGRDARRKGKEESEDESDSDSDDGKRTKTMRKVKKSKSDSGSDSSASEDSRSKSHKKKRVSRRKHRSDSGSSDDDSDTHRKQKRVKHGRHSTEKVESDFDSDNSDDSDDSSGSDSDHKKKAERNKVVMKKSKRSSRRHDSDDDSSSDSEPTRKTRKTHEAKKDIERRRDSDADQRKNNQLSGKPSNKDMGRQVERSKESLRGSLGRSAHDDQRRHGHELMDRYQPEKDDEVELNYRRQLTLKRKLDDDEQPELKPSTRSHQDDELRGRDREYHKKDAKMDHYSRSERPTRRDNEEQPEQKPSRQQSREDGESLDARRLDYSKSARPTSRNVDEIPKYEGRASKDENTGKESRRNDLSDAERHRSEKRNAWDEKCQKGKDFKRVVDDESKSKKRRVRDEEDLKSQRYQKDEVDGRFRGFSRDEENQPLNSRQLGRDDEEGRRGIGNMRSSKNEEDQPLTSRQHGGEEEEERRGRDHGRDGQLDHFKRPRYDKRNDDRARYRD